MLKKSQQNRRTKTLQTPQVVPAQLTVAGTKVKRGLKRPGPKLEELLKLVDLIPPGDKWELPERLVRDDFCGSEVLFEALRQLPPKLEAHLLQLANRPEEWPLKPEGLENFSEMVRQACLAAAVRSRYTLIRNSAEGFRRMARGRFLGNLFPTEVLIVKDKKGKAALVMYEPFVAAIIGEEIDYIRECAVCGRIFFAGRANQDACDPNTCAKTLRKRRERANAKLRIKRKRATTTRKR